MGGGFELNARLQDGSVFRFTAKAHPPVEHYRLLRSSSRLAAWSVCLLGSFIAGALQLSVAQDVVDLDSFGACSGCRIQPTLELRFGDASGPGIIESVRSRAVFDPARERYAVFIPGGTSVKIFDASGGFVASLGRQGGGPGELERLWFVQFSADAIAMLDARGPRIVVVDGTGKLRHDARIDVRPGPFQVIGPDSILIASMDQRPDVVGFPLHLIDVSHGTALSHFGSVDSRWSAAAPYGDLVRLDEVGRTTSAWIAYATRYRFEDWSLDGSLLRVVEGRPSWFKPPRLGREAPPSMITSFGIDGRERLWVMTRVRDPGWQSVPRHGAEGLISREDYDRAFDSRLDVYDLPMRKHIGFYRWDEMWVDLMAKDQIIYMQTVEFHDELVPQLALYRLEVLSNEHARR